LNLHSQQRRGRFAAVDTGFWGATYYKQYFCRSQGDLAGFCACTCPAYL